MTYTFLQQYWWLLVSLLGALLVFLMFVQGANTLIFRLGWDAESRRMIVNSTGRKWEFTFTTLVTFGGAFFASFPLFYSTSFGGAYWLWMIILFSFVLQAVSYEFQNKLGNLLGAKTFQTMLVINGVVGPLLLGGAVATFFTGSNFVIVKDNLTMLSSITDGVEGLTPVISRWANASHGLDALLNPWNVVLGLSVAALAQVLGLLYILNNVDDETMQSRASAQLVGCTIAFLVLFLPFLVYVLMKDGYAYDPATGVVMMEPMKYLHNLLDMWYLLILFVVGVVLLLLGVVIEVARKPADSQSPGCKLSNSPIGGIWPAGIGVVLVVWVLLLCAGWNNTAYYPSNVDLQYSLTIANSCSSEFTLRTMAVVSLLIPFVLAYICYAWYSIDKKKITREEIASDDHAY